MKFTQYLREVSFALSIACTASDKMRLAAATLLFHLANAVGVTRLSPPKRYRVKLIGQAHNLWLRTTGGDIFVLHEVFGSGCYEPSVDISKLRTIVDLGANVGLTTLYLAAKAPDARLICVEPVPGNAELLRRNLAPLPNAVVVQAAVANKSGVVCFDDNRPAWGGSISSQGRLQVESISMDELLARHVPEGPVDLLKMDIEGAELDVLSGPMLWLDRVGCIVAELHAPFTHEHFRCLMTRRGFDVVPGGMMPMAIRRAHIQ